MGSKRKQGLQNTVPHFWWDYTVSQLLLLLLHEAAWCFRFPASLICEIFKFMNRNIPTISASVKQGENQNIHIWKCYNISIIIGEKWKLVMIDIFIWKLVAYLKNFSLSDLWRISIFVFVYSISYIEFMFI